MTYSYFDFAADLSTGLFGFTIAGSGSGVGFRQTGGNAYANNTSTNIAWCNTDPTGSDQFARLTIVNATGTSFGPMVRMGGTTPATLTGYALRATQTELAILKFTDGAAANLKATSWNIAAGAVLEISALGGEIAAYLNGTEVLRVTDSTFINGKVGFRNSVTAAVRFDNFYGGDYADRNAVGAPAVPVPAKVVGLSAAAPIDSTISLSWSAAANAASYVLQYKLSSASAFTEKLVAGTLTQLTDLAAGTYQFKVYAVNETGLGPVSDVAEFTINGKIVVKVRTVALDIDDRIPGKYMPIEYVNHVSQEQVSDQIADAVALDGGFGATWRTSPIETFPTYLTAASALAMTSGHFSSVRTLVRETNTYTQVRFHVSTAAVAPANARVAIFDLEGVLLSTTDTLINDIISTGIKTVPLMTPVVLQRGQLVYVGIGHQGSTTNPAFARMAPNPITVNNDGVARLKNSGSGTPASGPPSSSAITAAASTVSVIPWIAVLT